MGRSQHLRWKLARDFLATAAFVIKGGIQTFAADATFIDSELDLTPEKLSKALEQPIGFGVSTLGL
jgi:hypothetical protein